MTATTTVLMRKNGDILWFDAILDFSKTYSGQVTKHPIERGGVISDHVTLENISYTLNGVISNADFNRDRMSGAELASLQDFIDEEFSSGGARVQILNNEPLDDPAEIKYSENPLTKFLPEAAAAFLDNTAPVVSMSQPFRLNSANVMENYFTFMQRSKEEFTVLEIAGNIVQRYANNCIFTNVTFKVDPESGDAVYPSLAFESVVWADSALVKIPKRVTDKLKSKAAPKENKGAQTGSKTEDEAAVPKRVSLAKQGVDKNKAAESTTPATGT